MPSRVTGYPDPGAAAGVARPPPPAYGWHPMPGGPASGPPPGVPPKPYYAYPPVGGPHPPYPHPPPPPSGHEQAHHDSARRGSNEFPGKTEDQDPYRRHHAHPYPPYMPPTAGRGPPGSSPASRSGSYDHHEYPRGPEGYGRGNPPIPHSRSMSSKGSNTSPRSSPPQGPRPNGFREAAVPHGYLAAGPQPHVRAPPGSSFDSDRSWLQKERSSPPSSHPPPEVGDYRGGSWRGAPHQYRAYPPPPHAAPPHARRSLEYKSSLPRPNSFDSRQASDASRNTSISINPPRATSPTQIESTRRDEVACMGCTCKKSKCLKLYCMCFGASVVCGPNCRCLVCYNTKEHETERKEAIRMILSRNPGAFDTKFKKTADKATTEPDRVLSHKVGCKCRKSACTKKYCECFNAGIKCSATCRCTGCQNMPPGGFGPPPPGYSFPLPQGRAYPLPPPNLVKSHSCIPEDPASTRPVDAGHDAAQSLAFMKHASPKRDEQGRPIVAPHPQISSMPSLGSSDSAPTLDSEGPPEGVQQDAGTETQKAAGNKDGFANALLMAAYAMTELQNDDTGSPDLPSAKVRASPKRKATSEHGVAGNGSGPAQLPDGVGDGSPVTTPPTSRKSKRSRVGTATRGNNGKVTVVLKDGPVSKAKAVGIESSSTQSSPSVAEERDQEEVSGTPSSARKTRSNKSKVALTPVSASCIDFRRMEVSGKKGKKGKVSP